MPVNIDREKGVPVLVRPIITKVNHRPAMRVSTTSHIILRIVCTFGLPISAGPVNVIGNARDESESVRIEVLSEHPFVTRPRNNVEEMLDDAVRHEHLTDFIESDTPRIRGAVRDDFKRPSRGMIPPDTTIH